MLLVQYFFLLKMGDPSSPALPLQTRQTTRFGYIATEETWDYTTADGRIAWELVLRYVTRGTGEQLVQRFVNMLQT